MAKKKNNKSKKKNNKNIKNKIPKQNNPIVPIENKSSENPQTYINKTDKITAKRSLCSGIV